MKKLDNRGSGIVTVLVAMLLIASLGTVLLSASLAGMRLKAAERRSGENFYDAETAMSEIRAGVQEAVTESIADAYEQVLVEYNSSMNAETAFRDKFEGALFSWEYATGQKLFSSQSLFSAAALESFVTVPDGADVTVKGLGTVVIASAPLTDENGNNIFIDGVEQYIDTSVTLKGVSVQYICDGYESNVASDIVITLPDFDYTLTEYPITGVPEFALIADTALTQNEGGSAELSISGSAYAGRIDLTNSGNTLTVSGGTLICGGDVSVSGTGFGGGTRFVVANTAALWANSIAVDSSVSLSGETYVANDLDLAGRGARAVLSGRYYGFGNSADDADKSSAIVINGQGTRLDMSDLKTLMLAGTSFIDAGTADVGMGQSVSVRSDQLAYLIPDGCIYYKDGSGKNVYVSNPYTFSGSTAPTWYLDADAVADAGLSAYIGSTADVKFIYSTIASTLSKIVYFYIDFGSRADANAYFQRYFENNSGDIERYLAVYSSGIAAAQVNMTGGTSYDYDSGANGELTLLDDYGKTLSGYADNLSESYSNLTVTLSAIKTSSAASPYEYVMNTDKLGAVAADMIFRAGDGDAVGVICTHASCRVSDYDGYSVIIATGNVTVDKDFTGLIIARGTVTMNASLYSDPEKITEALSAKNTAGETLMSYLNVGSTESSGDGQTGAGATWNTDDLVGYANWSKS